MYRVANNLAPETISDMYQVANNVHNYNMRYASDGNFLNRPNTTKGQRSTTFSGASVWSRVPATFKTAQSLVLLFKTQLKEYLRDNE